MTPRVRGASRMPSWWRLVVARAVHPATCRVAIRDPLRRLARGGSAFARAATRVLGHRLGPVGVVLARAAAWVPARVLGYPLVRVGVVLARAATWVPARVLGHRLAPVGVVLARAATLVPARVLGYRLVPVGVVLACAAVASVPASAVQRRRLLPSRVAHPAAGSA